MRVIPQENGAAWVQCGDIPICHCESIEKAEIVMDMLLEGVAAREELAYLKKTFYADTFDASVEMFEVHLLSSALGLANYNMSKAAKALGLQRTTLYEKAKRYGILEEKNGCESGADNKGAETVGAGGGGSALSGKGLPGSPSFGLYTDVLGGGENTGQLSKRSAAHVHAVLDREKNHSGDKH